MKLISFAAWLALATPMFLEAEEQAIQAAKAHVEDLMKAEWDSLEKSYAKDVILMPGHEFLKPKYGLSDQARSVAVKIERAKLVEAMRKASEGRPPRDVEGIDKTLEELACDVVETEVGNFATDPADPVDTPDGKLHFQIEPGDVLIRVKPASHPDYLLFQFRKIAGEWKIVSEYLD